MGSKSGKEAAAGTLGNLAFNDDNKILIRDAGAIPPLVDLLKPRNSEEAQVRLPSLPSSPPSPLPALPPLPLPLSSLLRPPSSPGRNRKHSVLALTLSAMPQEASGVCLWNLGLDPESRKEIVACDGIPHLVDLLDSPSERVRRTAAGALGKLALDDPARIEIARLRGIHKLLYMVANGSEDERETAANALTNLARNDSNRKIIRDDSVEVVKKRKTEHGWLPMALHRRGRGVGGGGGSRAWGRREADGKGRARR